MTTLEIKPVKEFDRVLRAPPSKAVTLRALFAASIAEGESVIRNPLLAQDQMLAIRALRALGASIDANENEVHVQGGATRLHGARLHAGNSGFSARMLTSLCALARGESVIDGSARLRERPVAGLARALRELGARVEGDAFPLRVLGPSLEGGECVVEGSDSSQFLSSLLFVAPLAARDVKIRVADGLVSRPYIDLTLDCLREFGVRVKSVGAGASFFVEGQQEFEACELAVEGDYSSAAFFFVAAAVTGGRVIVEGLRGDSKQGDKAFLDFIERMGCSVKRSENAIEVVGASELAPIDVELSDFPDLAMPLTVAALFASGKSVLRGVEHLRLKESDRLAALCEGISAIGGRVEVNSNSLVIEGAGSAGRNLHGALINPKNDHRIAMALSVAGLKVAGVKINDSECVGKSFPNFFKELGA